MAAQTRIATPPAISHEPVITITSHPDRCADPATIRSAPKLSMLSAEMTSQNTGAAMTTSMRGGYLQTVTSRASDEWPTPQWLVDQYAAEFGPFDTDPAATAQSAQAPVFYTLEDDGLAQPWKGRVWMNPPYSQVGTWMAKACAEVELTNAELVVCLVPARVDARWYRAAAAAASVVRVLPQRVKFGGCADSAPFPSAVIVFGDDGKRHGTRPQRCAACERYWFPVRSDARTCSMACRQRQCRVTDNKG